MRSTHAIAIRTEKGTRLNTTTLITYMMPNLVSTRTTCGECYLALAPARVVSTRVLTSESNVNTLPQVCGTYI